MSESQDSLCKESVFTKVFLDYSETLFNYLFYKSGDAKLSEDLTQESFLQLWQNCAKVAHSSVKGYVFTTGRNKLYNIFEHKKVQLKFQQLKHKESTNESPEFILESKELKLQLEQAISDLPEKQRVVFLLSRMDRKTYKEIAEIIGISKKAVEKRMYLALDTLRKVNKGIK